MYDHEIHQATTARLESIAASLGKFPVGAAADLGIRIAVELRGRYVRAGKIPPSEDRPRLRLMMRQDPC